MNKNRYESPALESFIISFLLANPQKSYDFIGILNPDDFSDIRLVKIAKVIKTIAERGVEPHANLVIEELNRIGELEKIGGRKYIISLYDSNFSLPSEITNHLRIVSEKKTLRDLRKIVTDFSKELDSGTKESAEISSLLLEKINLLNFSAQNETFVTIFEVAQKIFENLTDVHTKNKRIKGVSTGYDHLDLVTSGFQKGDLFILAARPSVGKTAFALNLAWNVCESGKSVLFFALEMSSADLGTRLLSLVTKIDAHTFKKPHSLRPNLLNQIAKTIEARIKNCNLIINDSGSINIDDIYWQVLKRYRNNQKFDLIVFDYLQLINSPMKNQNYNRQVEVSMISRKLKQLARETDTPILALSQLSRNVEKREDKIPVLSDLRESGAIEQDADIVAFLHRDNYYQKAENHQNYQGRPNTQLRIAKHRNGPLGILYFDFQPEIGQFVQATTDFPTKNSHEQNLGLDE
ncbi:replicative DNA helicase [Mycoplasma sp. 'Moose RK']|uniref:replicative DNA helicase n=1 Tax=Mycoplasma sp. 'Moose RK' TaxID=2780095 RepID=UPI0018C2B50D|nr:replicative DNA helicase [Mycoplasma sp. 'Moose RK']MBG0730642.1 replicative DNA helicase [Mycoplasma sp. 'Moose RK']